MASAGFPGNFLMGWSYDTHTGIMTLSWAGDGGHRLDLVCSNSITGPIGEIEGCLTMWYCRRDSGQWELTVREGMAVNRDLAARFTNSFSAFLALTGKRPEN